jgi:hypothetical protein
MWNRFRIRLRICSPLLQRFLVLPDKEKIKCFAACGGRRGSLGWRRRAPLRALVRRGAGMHGGSPGAGGLRQAPVPGSWFAPSRGGRGGEGREGRQPCPVRRRLQGAGRAEENGRCLPQEPWRRWRRRSRWPCRRRRRRGKESARRRSWPPSRSRRRSRRPGAPVPSANWSTRKAAPTFPSSAASSARSAASTSASPPPAPSPLTATARPRATSFSSAPTTAAAPPPAPAATSSSPSAASASRPPNCSSRRRLRKPRRRTSHTSTPTSAAPSHC